MTDLWPLISQNVSACKNTKMADITPPSTAHANLSCTLQLSNSTVIRQDGIFLFMQNTRTRNINWSVTAYAVFSLPRCFQLTAVILLPKFFLSRSYITFLLQHKSRLGKIHQFNPPPPPHPHPPHQISTARGGAVLLCLKKESFFF